MIGLLIMQKIDAVFILGTVGFTLIVLQRDYRHASIAQRGAIIAFIIMAYWQAMWLLGEWIPGVSGFPLPRLMMDSAMFCASGLKVWQSYRRAGRIGSSKDTTGAGAGSSR